MGRKSRLFTIALIIPAVLFSATGMTAAFSRPLANRDSDTTESGIVKATDAYYANGNTLKSALPGKIIPIPPFSEGREIKPGPGVWENDEGRSFDTQKLHPIWKAEKPSKTATSAMKPDKI